MKARDLMLRCYWGEWQLKFVQEHNTYCVWEQSLYKHNNRRRIRIGTLQKIIVRDDDAHALGRGTHWGFSFASETVTSYFSSRPAAVRRLRN